MKDGKAKRNKMDQAKTAIKKTYNALYSAVKPIASLIYPLKHVGRENIPEGPAVVCANHSNYVDPVLVALAFGRKNMLQFMAKKELFKNPVVAKIFRSCGVIPVDRGETDMGAIRAAMKCLGSGGKILIFPEGTRSENDNVEPKTGAVRIAAKMKAPIIPVYVPRGKKAFGLVTIRIGKPYYVEAKTHEEYQAASVDLMRRISALGKKNK